MKKALIASTALVLSAGVAAADVTISGYGRTAVDYQENRAPGEKETQISARVRLNVHATTSTDQGVDFGARVRLQWDQGDDGIDSVSPGQVYVTASGFTVAIGNVGTAYDNAGLLYESEVGLISRSFGVSTDFDYFAYSSKSYATEDRLGVSVEYAVDALTARFSYIDPDQTGLTDTDEELGLSVDYDWNGIALSAAAVKDGAGRDGNDRYFVGAYYTLPGTENGVGLSFADDGIDSDGLSNDNIVTLWGDYTVAPLTTLSAYIANNGKAGNETDNAFGLGARYDLGGAYLAGSLERGYDENVRGDFGVRFDF
ncbi:porin [Paracoccus sp. PAMC 22219]|uniref:porin n=1 Tax=Paracoccus sp. PAMC 22219 TaxID=1569209 RepID=UPI0005AB844B|nr:porin [Paracoccus sp. PAMC 22219]